MLWNDIFCVGKCECDMKRYVNGGQIPCVCSQWRLAVQSTDVQCCQQVERWRHQPTLMTCSSRTCAVWRQTARNAPGQVAETGDWTADLPVHWTSSQQTTTHLYQPQAAHTEQTIVYLNYLAYICTASVYIRLTMTEFSEQLLYVSSILLQQWDILYSHLPNHWSIIIAIHTCTYIHTYKSV